MKTQTKKTQELITPEFALKILKDGNSRFVQNLKANRNLLEQVNETSSGQFPFATILSCIDSRTSAELIFDQGLGDVFSIRIAGNIVNKDILGSMEFATKLAGTKIILVLGHTKCGAISGACNHVQLGNLTHLLAKITPSIEQEKLKSNDINSAESLYNITEFNVLNAIEIIRNESEVLKELEDNNEIKIIGAMYDITTGEVVFL